VNASERFQRAVRAAARAAVELHVASIVVSEARDLVGLASAAAVEHLERAAVRYAAARRGRVVMHRRLYQGAR
jgi:hypothetical protein